MNADNLDSEFRATACDYPLSDTLRQELLKNGFLLVDENGQGFNYFSKLENVYDQRVFYFKKEGEGYVKLRAVFVSKPSVLKMYVGAVFPCGFVYGFRVGVENGSPLEIDSLSVVRFAQN